MMTDIAPAASTTLTLDTLTWGSAISLGIEARKAGDEAKWSLGDVGAIVAHKWQRDSIKRFASEIGLDNHKRLYEYIQVATYWESAHRQKFPPLSWSHFREAARHDLPVSTALDWLTQASDKSWPVAALREAITGNPNEPITRRAVYEVTPLRFDEDYSSLDLLIDNRSDMFDIQETLKRPGATLELRVTWLEQR